MAHIGNPAPVIFRRDFNLNVRTYNDGWSNRYIATLTQLPLGIGNQLVGSQWDCGPGTIVAADTMVWQSLPQLIGIFAWDILLTATITGGTSYIKGFQVREAISGVVGIFRCTNDPAANGPNFPFFNTWSSTFLDPFFFHPPGSGGQVNCVRKEWALGPPH